MTKGIRIQQAPKEGLCARCRDEGRIKRVFASITVDVVMKRRRHYFIPLIRKEANCCRISRKFVFACSKQTKNRFTNRRKKLRIDHIKKAKLGGIKMEKAEYDDDDDEDEFEDEEEKKKDEDKREQDKKLELDSDDHFAIGILDGIVDIECNQQVAINNQQTQICPSIASHQGEGSKFKLLQQQQSNVIDSTISLMIQLFKEHDKHKNPTLYIRQERWKNIQEMICIGDRDTALQEIKQEISEQIKNVDQIDQFKQIVVPFKHLGYICMYIISLTHKAAYLLHPNLQSILEDKIEAPHFRIVSKTFTPALEFILEGYEYALQDHHAKEIQVKRNEINELITRIKEDKFALYNFTTPQLIDGILISQEYLMAYNITKVGKSYGYTSRNFTFQKQEHADKIIKYINHIHKKGFIFGFMDI